MYICYNVHYNLVNVCARLCVHAHVCIGLHMIQWHLSLILAYYSVKHTPLMLCV